MFCCMLLLHEGPLDHGLFNDSFYYLSAATQLVTNVNLILQLNSPNSAPHTKCMAFCGIVP